MYHFSASKASRKPPRRQKFDVAPRAVVDGDDRDDGDIEETVCLECASGLAACTPAAAVLLVAVGPLFVGLAVAPLLPLELEHFGNGSGGGGPEGVF